LIACRVNNEIILIVVFYLLWHMTVLFKRPSKAGWRGKGWNKYEVVLTPRPTKSWVQIKVLTIASPLLYD